MQKLIWISLSLIALAAVLAAAGACWMLRDEEPEWTTRSPAALKELRAGLDDRSKNYFYDAAAHFERALKLDPDFAAAKLYLAQVLPPGHPERRRRLEDLRASVDPAALTPRERFLVAYGLAGSEDDAHRILGAFLAEHPEDPFAIRAECDLYWEDQDWNEAESCYHRLLRLHPKWVEAQDRLGRIAMARGLFDEAEEQFHTCRYLAPDQALPLASLGELMIVLGRYEEAEEVLGEAIRIKSDYCDAYRLRIRLHSFAGRLDRAREVLEQLAEIPTCGYYREFGYFCQIEALLRFQAGDPEGAWQPFEGDCLKRREGFDLIAHRIAVMTGRNAESEAIEEAMRAHFEKVLSAGQPVYADYYAAISAHMEGVRSLAVGDAPRAAEHFYEADRRLGYWGGDRASFKMFNRLNLLRVLELTGRSAEAAELRQEIAAVNPRVVEDFKIPDLETLPSAAAKD